MSPLFASHGGRIALALLKSEVVQAGGRLGIAIIPSRDDLVEGDKTKIEWILKICEANHIPSADLSARLLPAHFFDVDLHFNVAGHRVVADTLESFVLDPQLAGQELRGPQSTANQAARKE